MAPSMRSPGVTRRARMYGGWFHSAILYLRFSLVEGGSAQWGTSPPGYYAEFIFRSMPIIAACLGIGLLAGLRYAPALSVLALLFIAAHSAIPHKEFRFILPMLPLAVAATVTSFDALPRRTATGRYWTAARWRCRLGGDVSVPDLGRSRRTPGSRGGERVGRCGTDQPPVARGQPASGPVWTAGGHLPRISRGVELPAPPGLHLPRRPGELGTLQLRDCQGGIRIAGRGAGSRHGTGQGHRERLQAGSGLRLEAARENQKTARAKGRGQGKGSPSALAAAH